ncbi:hypothetical protein L210DRAFT_3502892 [Boletus edulis BED1]|uniref:Uncharacterized protein n=1 Tax=Boletus edulis BED1 TaxID=1328754 RepID=A0AAD4BZ32_BOLED|nr:hypothetical protein L210DRAFT_3502892 [Boletus edulis BED1]
MHVWHAHLVSILSLSPPPPIFGSSLLNDTKNMEYTTNISLNGKPFPDAGSSDLWVSAPVPGAISQNYSAGITAQLMIPGPVMSATLDFAGFSVDDFALDGSGTHDPGALMGLGPGVGSITRMGENSGDPFPGYISVGEFSPTSTLLDVNGIIGPNGTQIEIKTQVTGVQTQNDYS